MYEKAKRECGMSTAGPFAARAYKPLITILSLFLYTPSYEIPKTKIWCAPIDGCFLPASLLITEFWQLLISEYEPLMSETDVLLKVLKSIPVS
jgi:hypothetical protein